MKEINIMEFLKEEKTGDFHLNCGLPIGYVAGFPIVAVKSGKACLKIPFLKYKITGQVDKTLVYPVKYVLTYSLPEMKPIGFEDLEYNIVFKHIDFNKPIGYFRHDAIKSLTKKAYAEKKNELLELYDDLAMTVVDKKPFSDGEEFKKVLNMMLEPSVKPIYKVLDRDFYDKYLA
ncbi:MAG: hypothetical protein E7415_01025 [Ruminococcaceae bacterium]|nr:hypothetical protein [Oscillospiraceae bacterium]